MPRSIPRSVTEGAGLLQKNRNDKLVQALGAAVEAAVPGRSPWMDARERFMRNRAAVAGLCLLALIVLLCGLGSLVLPHAFDSAD
jgi:oligopeptide transport system permease protein